MKKKLSILATLLIGLLATTFAQTIVGTDPENKNVVLEEFTGIYCGYCPDGHAIAQAIYNAHPNDVVLLAIHTGSYANPSGGDPDFRTPFGSAIAGQSGLTGYPAGTVNRHLFPGWSQGSGTAMSRGQWTPASNLILDESSYLNVALEATISPATRQLTVLVEVYYTGDSPESMNLLNVAIAQNHIFGPQSGGGAGNNYEHMHMLRHLLTGQWGIEINETTEGSFYTTTLSYEIPEDYNDVEVVLEDLDIVAFVSETHQEIISGIKGTVTFPAESEYDVAVKEIVFPISQACEGILSPRFELKNYGSINLTSADVEYSVNGGDVATYTWEGDMAYPDSEIITLPGISYNMEDNNTLEITVSNPNGNEDENPANNTKTVDFVPSYETSMNVSMKLFCGAYASDLSWEFFDGNGEVLASGSDYGTNEIVEMDLPVYNSDCYNFVLYDQTGDGFSGGGYLKLMDDGEVFVHITDELEDLIGITFHPNNPLAGPSEFEVSVNNYDLDFTWTAPATKALTGYNIYEQSDMATPINSTLLTEESFAYTVASNGNYAFYIVAEYDEGSSDYIGPVFADITVGIEKLETGAINIYPNPVNNLASISYILKEESLVSIKTYNLTGSLVIDLPFHKQDTGEQIVQLNTSDLEEGLYFVKLQINNQVITKKITVLK